MEVDDFDETAAAEEEQSQDDLMIVIKGHYLALVDGYNRHCIG